MSSSISHAHHHHHHHDPVAQANREYFDNPENDYQNNLAFKELAARAARAILNSCTMDKEKTTVMDFACGIGNVSKELVPYAKSILGIDISQRSIDLYNERFKDDERASGVCIELKGEEGELSNPRFDVIFCVAAYHHFASIEDITRILASFLNPGGVLVVVDMVFHEGDHKFLPEHAVPHKHGVSKQDMQAAFDGANLTLKGFEEVPAVPGHSDQGLFLAVGEKVSA